MAKIEGIRGENNIAMQSVVEQRRCDTLELKNSISLFLSGIFMDLRTFVPEDQASPIMPWAAIDDDLGRPPVKMVQQERARAERA